jgi:flagellar hook-associated protein 2
MYGNVTRISGLMSGMDTASMVKQLMNAESLKMNKLKQKKQLLEWQQAGFRDVATALQNFQKSVLEISYTNKNSMNMTGNFKRLVASASVGGADTSAIKVSAGSSATEGSFSLKILSLAQKDVYIGSAGSLTAEDGVTNLDLRAAVNGLPADGKMDFTVTLDGKETTVSISKQEILDHYGTGNINRVNFGQFLTQKFAEHLNAPDKVTIQYDQAAGKFNVIAGAGHTVSIGKNDEDNNFLPSSLGSFAALGFTGPATTAPDLNAVVSAGDFSLNINGKSINFAGGATLEQVIVKINDTADAGVKVKYDNATKSFVMESVNAGAGAKIRFDTNTAEFFRDNLNLTLTEANNITKAQDTVYEYNGRRLSSEGNILNIDGVSVTLTAAAVGQTFTVDIKRDNTAVVDMVKNFVTEYNKMLDAINKYYGAARPKSGNYNYYEPLTDDQKKAMSEKEIDQWEQKAMTGMLYHDPILTSLTSNLRRMMYEPVFKTPGDDKSAVYLFQAGITTTNEYGHIGKLQLNEEKLAAMLEKDLDGVIALFTQESGKPGSSVRERNERMAFEGLANRLSDIIDNTVKYNGTIWNRAGLTGTASANNNILYKQIKAQEDKIADLTQYLYRRETYYYNMFSKMETAMAKSNSQMDSLYAMIGG